MTGSTSSSGIALDARTNARTRWPRSRRTRATCHPTNPEAPVTSVDFIPNLLWSHVRPRRDVYPQGLERTIAVTTHGHYLAAPPETLAPAGLLVGFHGYGEN